MPGPWEKYKQSEESEGPWSKYASEDEAPSEFRKISPGEAAKIGLEKWGTLGFRPTVAGLAGAAGSGYETLKSGKGLLASLEAAKSAYPEARSEAYQEQEEAYKQQPIAYSAGAIPGALISGRALGIGGLGLIGQGIVGGAIGGAGESLGQGKDIEDVAKDTGIGAAIGGAIPIGFKSIGAAAKSKAGQYVGGKVKDIGAKIGSVAGPSEDTIKHYAANVDKINNMVKQYGGDVAEMADQARANISSKIMSWKNSMSNTIKQQMEKAHPEKSIELSPITDALEAVKSRINPKLYPERIASIDEMISKAKDVAGESNLLSPSELHEIKGFLQDMASGAYMKNGQIFQIGKEAEIAAKNGAAVARKTINKIFPQYAEANNKLAALHNLEGKINKNLITAGKPEGSFLSAGAGTNPRAAKQLENIGGLIGEDVLGAAKDINAARTFGNAGLFSTSPTGRSLLGPVTGGAVGGKIGAAAGSVISSPMALKGAINAFNIARKAGDSATMRKLAPLIQNAFIQTQVGGE